MAARGRRFLFVVFRMMLAEKFSQHLPLHKGSHTMSYILQYRGSFRGMGEWEGEKVRTEKKKETNVLYIQEWPYNLTIYIIPVEVFPFLSEDLLFICYCVASFF